MQPVNDDMDNLFRRAADSYPLHTSGADFDKVRQQADAETPVPEKKEPKRRYLWLLLLLLIPLPFLLRYYQADPMPPYNQGPKKYEVSPQENQNTLPAATTPDSNNNTNGKEGILTSENKKNESVRNMPDQLATKAPETVDVQTQPARNATANPANNSSRKQQINKAKSLVSSNQTNRQTTAVISRKDKRYQPQPGNESVLQSANSKKINNKSTPLTGKKNNDTAPGKLLNTANAVIIKKTDTDTGKTITDSIGKTMELKQPTDSAIISKAKKANDSTNNEVVKKAAKNNNRNKPGVYIGIITGPDFSAVKSNRIDGAGYNIGFLAGYQAGRHLAFETGVIWNYKRYYSKGENVKTDNLSLLQHTEVLHLNGSCYLMEIPLNVHYHFNSHANGNWYLGAGVSSYIMKKEDYHYASRRYNMEYYGYKEYTNSTKNWLSVLQLHAGYQINFKQAGSLHIEPYAKLPLQGIGIGKLPLSSAGINFGFTIPVH